MKAKNLHASRNKHIWKLIFFLDIITISSNTKWNSIKHISQGSWRKEKRKRKGNIRCMKILIKLMKSMPEKDMDDLCILCALITEE